MVQFHFYSLTQFHFHSWTWTPPSAIDARRKAGAELAVRERPYLPPDELNSRNVNLMGRSNPIYSPRKGVFEPSHPTPQAKIVLKDNYLAVWREAIERWPDATITLPQGAPVVHDSRRRSW
jgi:hypothetical protein